jgi:hypothetical protein
MEEARLGKEAWRRPGSGRRRGGGPAREGDAEEARLGKEARNLALFGKEARVRPGSGMRRG